MDRKPDCPDEGRLASLWDGVLPPDEADAVASHIGGCPACRTLLGEWSQACAVRALPVARDWLRPARLAAAACLLAACGAALVWRSGRTDRLAVGPVQARTSERIALRDGTILSLLPGAVARDISVRAGERRRVRLETGSLEVVASHAGGAFVVETACMDLQVVGTRFEVRVASLPDGRSVSSVAVSEGTVRAITPPGEVDVPAGYAAYAADGLPPFPQAGSPPSDPVHAAALLRECSAAARAGRPREALWVASMLAVSDLVPDADLAEALSPAEAGE